MIETILPIVVIGGGFSGTLTAVHLSRRLPRVPVILLEEDGEAGPGVAYQESDVTAWLNVPAGKMSAFADKPDHFLQYARRVLGEGVFAEDFLPRRTYGGYLKEILAQEQERNPLLHVDYRQAVDVTGGEGGVAARVVLKDQSVIEASSVVLATGNQGSAFSSSIWGEHALSAREPAALQAVSKGEDVLIVGTGLTMVDAALDLDRRGDARVIHAISRHGLLPRPYTPPSELEPAVLEHLPDSDLRKTLRIFRREVRKREEEGGNWQDLVAAIRTSTPSLWQELSHRERSRFLRFLSPFWEVHRHQCAPETYAKIQRLIESGKLVLHQGTIVSIEQAGERVKMGLAARAKDEPVRWLEVDRLLDATGPARDLTTIRHPLIQNLLRRGFLRPDPHRLGAETSPDYRSIGRGGQPSDWLFVVGPMLRARFFEATAVYELRLHTAALAARLQSLYQSQETEDYEASEELAGV